MKQGLTYMFVEWTNKILPLPREIIYGHYFSYNIVLDNKRVNKMILMRANGDHLPKSISASLFLVAN